MKFFDTTPTGRILNRFSKDMDEGISHWSFLSCSGVQQCSPPLAFLGATHAYPPPNKGKVQLCAPASENKVLASAPGMF